MLYEDRKPLPIFCACAQPGPSLTAAGLSVTLGVVGGVTLGPAGAVGLGLLGLGLGAVGGSLIYHLLDRKDCKAANKICAHINRLLASHQYAELEIFLQALVQHKCDHRLLRDILNGIQTELVSHQADAERAGVNPAARVQLLEAVKNAQAPSQKDGRVQHRSLLRRFLSVRPRHVLGRLQRAGCFDTPAPSAGLPDVLPRVSPQIPQPAAGAEEPVRRTNLPPPVLGPRRRPAHQPILAA